MKTDIFVAVIYNRDHEAEVVGAGLNRKVCLAMVQKALGKPVEFSEKGIDVPDGNVAIGDDQGDMVGCVLHFKSGADNDLSLEWRWDSESDSLQAPSIYHDHGSRLNYAIECRSEEDAEWEAMFDGYPIGRGSLQDCIAACLQSEIDAWVSGEEQESNRRA
jgi:hypothetical protein